MKLRWIRGWRLYLATLFAVATSIGLLFSLWNSWTSLYGAERSNYERIENRLRALDQVLEHLERTGGLEYSPSELTAAREARRAVEVELEWQRGRLKALRSFSRAAELLVDAELAATDALEATRSLERQAREEAVASFESARLKLSAVRDRWASLEPGSQLYRSELEEQIRGVESSIGSLELALTERRYRAAHDRANTLGVELVELAERLRLAVQPASELDASPGELLRQPAHAVWNAWWELRAEGGPKFDPLHSLERHQPYSLVVDLGKLAYGSNPGLRTWSASRSFRRALSELGADSRRVEILLLPDGEYFEPLQQTERVKWLEVDLRRFRQEQVDFQLAGSDDPMAALREGRGNSLSLGRQVFQLETTGSSGWAQMGISVWIDKRPVDEFSLSVCIAPCPEIVGPRVSLASLNLRGADFEGRVPEPDAALHIVEFAKSELVGVFRCNRCGDGKEGEFQTWRLENSLKDLEARIREEILPALHEQARDNAYSVAGEALYDALFATDDQEASEAESRFRDFVEAAIAASSGSAYDPYSIFIRLLPADSELSFVIPFDLVKVPVANGTEVFLGSLLIVTNALQYEDYGATSGCISSWSLLVPPATRAGSDNLLRDARVHVSRWIEAFSRARDHSHVCEDPECFRQWLRARAEPASIALVTLSHHVPGRLCFSGFDCLGPSVQSSNIRRRFGSPSVAVIAACGTAQPGATAFLRRFNLHGVGTAIATSTSIEAELAGSFLARLFEVLAEEGDGASPTLARAKFEACRRLADTPKSVAGGGATWGPRALLFTLLGNGNVRVCLPESERRLEG